MSSLTANFSCGEHVSKECETQRVKLGINATHSEIHAFRIFE